MVEITKEIRDAAKVEFDRWDAASGIGKTGKMFQVIRICNQGSIVDFLDRGIGYAIMGEYVFRSEMTAALATMRFEAVVAAVAPLIEAAVRAEGWRPTHRHVKRGSGYEIVGDGKLQTKIPIGDMAELRAYRAKDGTLWFRPVAEFEDGRFEKLPAPPRSAP